MFKGLIRKEKRADRGQGMVEFALILPVLLMLILGVFEFGHLLFVYSAVSAASREAARYGTAAGAIGFGGVPRYLDCAGITSAARRIGGLVGVNTVTITYDKGPGGASLGNCASPGEIELGARINITVNATVDPFIPVFDIQPINLTSTTRRTIVTSIPVGTPVPLSAPLTVSFLIASQNTLENVGTITVQLRLSSAAVSAVVVPILISGTATDGDDYDIDSSQIPVIFNPGSTTATISIDIADDGVFEYDESIVLSIGAPNGAIKGSPGTHTIIITGAPEPPVVEYSLIGITRDEDSGIYDIEVVLNKVWTQDVSVSFSVTGGTAQVADYVFVTASPLVIPIGSTSGIIQVAITDDLLDEVDENLVITLDSPIEATLGTQVDFSLTILDDDVPVVSFQIAGQAVNEEIGTVNIIVLMDRVSAFDVTVPFTVTGNASAADYTISASPVFIPQGSTQGIISVNLVTETSEEPNEKIIITLGSAVNAVVGTPNPYTLTIIGNSPVPSVTFDIQSQTVNENVGLVTILVELSQPYSGGKVVIPFTLSGSALGGGVDYTILNPSPLEVPAGSLILVWAIRIQINNDNVREDLEKIVLTMDAPTNATLGEFTVHTVNINFSDPHADLSVAGSFASQFPQATFKDYNITFALSLNNAGPDPATNAMVSVSLPLGYLYLSHTTSAGTSYTPASGQWSVGTLAVGSTVNLNITAKVLDTLAYQFYAQVFSVSESDPDSTPGNYSTFEDDDHVLTPKPESKCALSSAGYTIADSKYTWVIDNNGSVSYRMDYIQVPWKKTPSQQFNKFAYNGVQIGGEDSDDELLIGFEAGVAAYVPADPNFVFDATNALTRQLNPGVVGTPGKGTIAIDFRNTLTLQTPSNSTVVFVNLVTNDICQLVRGKAP